MSFIFNDFMIRKPQNLIPKDLLDCSTNNSSKKNSRGSTDLVDIPKRLMELNMSKENNNNNYYSNNSNYGQ